MSDLDQPIRWSSSNADSLDQRDRLRANYDNIEHDG